MPWLVGTALIHSLAVTEKRGAFKNWTVLLAIITFSLSLLGTFLVRSGVLTSVHAFATDPERGVFILAFLGIVIGLSLILYAWRAPKIGRGGSFAPWSRESLLLINNVLLVVASASVLLGTLYPLFLDALNLGKISVGPPYFDRMFFFLMAPLTFLLGLGLITRWKKDQVINVFSKVRIAFGISLGLGLLLPMLILGLKGLVVLPGITAAIWILVTSFQAIWERLKYKSNWRQDLRTLPLSFQGAVIAHTGVAFFIVGVTLSGAYSVEKDVRLEPHKAVTVAGYQFVFEGTQKIEGPNYSAEQGRILVKKGEKTIAVLQPQKRLYKVQNMPMTEAAIDPGLTRDIYVALGEPLDNGAWSARLYYKPFIRWIWFGALFMAFGGILAASDKRYRLLTKSSAQTQAFNPSV
jgi:cytochrome c-type biogenesis protein CcmF